LKYHAIPIFEIFHVSENRYFPRHENVRKWGKKEEMFNQKLFQITNIFAFSNKKAEIQNFVILPLNRLGTDPQMRDYHSNERRSLKWGTFFFFKFINVLRKCFYLKAHLGM